VIGNAAIGSDGLRIDAVIVGMAADEAHIDVWMAAMNDESVSVSADVEDHPPLFEDGVEKQK